MALVSSGSIDFNKLNSIAGNPANTQVSLNVLHGLTPQSLFDGTYPAVSNSTTTVSLGSYEFTFSGNQQANLNGTGLTSTSGSRQGNSTAMNAAGTTFAFGSFHDNSEIGSVFVFTGSGSSWTQQGNKLVPSDYSTYAPGNNPSVGASIALSSDGNTLAMGGPNDYTSNPGYLGATWIFTRSGSTWTQQGSKIVGTGYSLNTEQLCNQGTSVALSADGNTLATGGNGDNNGVGATWVFTRSGTTWAQQGSKIVPTGYVLANYGSSIGTSVALSADGNTLAIGAPADNNLTGATWVFTRSGTTWTQQGSKLVGTGSPASPNGAGFNGQGYTVALSADGNTLVTSGYYGGVFWTFTRSGSTWTQQGNYVLVGSGGYCNDLSLSADGNTLSVASSSGLYIYTRSGSTWSQVSNPITGQQITAVAWGQNDKVLAVGNWYAGTGYQGTTYIYT